MPVFGLVVRVTSCCHEVRLSGGLCVQLRRELQKRQWYIAKLEREVAGSRSKAAVNAAPQADDDIADDNDDEDNDAAAAAARAEATQVHGRHRQLSGGAAGAGAAAAAAGGGSLRKPMPIIAGGLLHVRLAVRHTHTHTAMCVVPVCSRCSRP